MERNKYYKINRS